LAPLGYEKDMDTSLNSLEEALSIRREMDTLEKRLASILGTAISSGSTNSGKPQRMSAATRIAAGARARWASVKTGTGMPTTPLQKKSGLTPAGRKRLSQLMKARWAARKKQAVKK
jgi:hypothetical protein